VKGNKTTRFSNLTVSCNVGLGYPVSFELYFTLLWILSFLINITTFFFEIQKLVAHLSKRMKGIIYAPLSYFIKMHLRFPAP